MPLMSQMIFLMAKICNAINWLDIGIEPKTQIFFDQAITAYFKVN